MKRTRLFEQLQFSFGKPPRLPAPRADPEIALPCSGELEAQARELLRAAGASKIARGVRVEWNARMRSGAGRADYRALLVSLNPRLREHGRAEVDRTLRHELAHLLAHFRAGRQRIEPHGAEWRQACADLGIAGEARCHTLPFPRHTMRRPFVYGCAGCGREFPRVRKIRRAVACLACCRQHAGGQFDSRFKLRLIA